MLMVSTSALQALSFGSTPDISTMILIKIFVILCFAYLVIGGIITFIKIVKKIRSNGRVA